MTTPQKNDKKENKTFQNRLDENLFFNMEKDIILTEQELKALEKSLVNLKVDKKTSSFFKSAYKFYKKLEKNDFNISLEEIERE
jgi:hypothetical protein